MISVSGFSLVELIVVMTLLGLLMAMLPSGLINQYDSLSLESEAHRVADSARQCSLKAQSAQRTLIWGSTECSVSAKVAFEINLSKNQPLLFTKDGSSSGERIIISNNVQRGLEQSEGSDLFVIDVDHITSHTEVIKQSYAGASK